MQPMHRARSRVVERENNILRVDFRHEPDPPAPKFPGAGAMHEIRLEETEEAALAHCTA
jgi:hypothetical protein